MSLQPGTRLGAYEITGTLGAGGMGEVYRARDTRLHRDVALKVLPETFASDTDRLARFDREAQVLASLNHPNIAQIYGLESSNGVLALVMELVEGPTLADRIATGPIPLDEALAIAKQIAHALEAAHERGIIHRDLKPANIKLRPDGAVKVLDFGLAKALEPAVPADAAATISPTLSLHATQAGIILGTVAYMSPEQARGKAADTRADIWAFGVVFFEMLAGRRPFEDDEISDIIANILKSEPAWQVLPSDMPAAIHRLLRRCLQKDRQQRLQHIGDARLDIEEAQQATGSDAPRRVLPHRERLAWVVAVIVAAVVGVIGGRGGVAPEAPEMRVDINAAGVQTFALSPDGRKIAFTADGQTGRQLWIRFLDQSAPRPLRGTEGAVAPFWSPDSQSLGFVTTNSLKRLDLESGESQSLANVITPAGATWSRDGTILYVPNDNGGIFRISASGGNSTAVTPDRSPALATRLPQFLPDGRHFLFYVARGGEPSGVYVGQVGSDTIRRLLAADAPARYGAGHLWFVREDTLFAQEFEPSTQQLSGPVIRIADDVAVGTLAASISTSDSGSIAYRTGSGTRSRLIWLDRSGKQVGVVGEEAAAIPAGFAASDARIGSPSLSPDGKRLVVQRTIQQNIDVWVLDLERNVFTRQTLNPGIDAMPLWSPDGNQIVFSSFRDNDNVGQLFVQRIDTGASGALRLPQTRSARIVCDWSPDGRFILYKDFDQATGGSSDLWVIPMEGRGTPDPVAQSPHNERDGQFSPDGKWIAYESDESGQPEIYLQPFPGPGAKVRISTSGGRQVRWRRNGREMFYIAADDTLMSVSIGSPTGPSGIGTPVPLFKTRTGPLSAIERQQYVVAPDGQRFLVITRDEASAAPITLILNWKTPSPRER
jgi:eukaryotic-like serine/threonine-protein kinase